jgi:NifU homolog involved in Fe-S cluster formation
VSETPYNPVVIEHFGRPRNVGRFATADDVIAASAGDPDLGVRFDLSARVKGDRIVALRFEVYGCPHCIAAGSLLSERLQGATQEELRRWSWRQAADELEFPPEKRGRLLTLEDAVHALARQ